jgi:mono/diheme cytochrome c family protein
MVRLLGVIGALAILVVIGAGVYLFGGFYDVAANGQDNGALAWGLQHIRRASIERHANAAPPSSLDDPALIRAGAHAFLERGCVNCHGGPGVSWAKFSEGLNPGPPDLKDVVGRDEPAELFWIIKNGIRMTAMPSFGATGVSDQEIWSIVAFLKKLPNVSDTDFKSWSMSGP